MTGELPSQPKATVLVVDDEAAVRRVLVMRLQLSGYRVVCAEDGEQALELFHSESPDLIVLDVMLPKLDGFAVCRRLRAESCVPIIFLSAVEAISERVAGLDLGADDYLPKPFSPRELLARINAIIRRQTTLGAPSPKQVVRFGSFEFDTENRNLSHEGKNISITAGEFDLLKVFTDHAKQPLSRDRIMQLAKGKELDVFDRSIDVQISRIRRLIEDNPNKPKYLQTKWGYGYIFDPDGEAQ